MFKKAFSVIKIFCTHIYHFKLWILITEFSIKAVTRCCNNENTVNFLSLTCWLFLNCSIIFCIPKIREENMKNLA